MNLHCEICDANFDFDHELQEHYIEIHDLEAVQE